MRASGLNGWPCTIPNEASRAQQLLAEGLGRLVADNLVHPLERRGILGRKRVPGNAGDVLDNRWARSGLQRVDLGVLAVVLEGLITITDLGGVGPDEGEVRVGWRPHDKVTIGHVAFIVRRQQQVLATLALVHAGRANVGHEEEVVIVQRPHDTRRNLEDRRAVLLQIEHDEGIQTLGIAGQDQGARVQAVRSHADV
jgi:hypothetical protein